SRGACGRRGTSRARARPWHCPRPPRTRGIDAPCDADRGLLRAVVVLVEGPEHFQQPRQHLVRRPWWGVLRRVLLTCPGPIVPSYGHYVAVCEPSRAGSSRRASLRKPISCPRGSEWLLERLHKSHSRFAAASFKAFSPVCSRRFCSSFFEAKRRADAGVHPRLMSWPRCLLLAYA